MIFGNMNNTQISPSSLRNFFYSLFKNIGEIFWKKNLIWHLLAMVLTAIIVLSDFDWWYFKHTQGATLQAFLFPAVLLGGLVPIIGTIGLYVYGVINKNLQALNLAFAVGQASALGLFVSWFYKALTGRAHPLGFMRSISNIDISKVFKFGFLRGGVFWGWPSSHTAVSFAFSLAIFILFPKNKFIRILAIVYAFYVGIGVSTSIHWFSDFVAGAIFGSVVGITVGKRFLKRQLELARQ